MEKMILSVFSVLLISLATGCGFQNAENVSNELSLAEQTQNAVVTEGFSIGFYGAIGSIYPVKGTRVSFMFNLTGVTISDESYKVYYGYADNQLSNSLVLKPTGYGNAGAGFVLPKNPPSDRLYFKVSGKGNDYLQNGKNFNAKIQESYISTQNYGHTKNSIDILYAGKSLANNIFVHYGFDGWKNVADKNMTVSSYDNQIDYARVTIENIPAGTKKIDLVFCGNGVWDNNQNQDFHISLDPYIEVYANYDSNSLTGTSSKLTISIGYWGSGYLQSPVSVHYGFNNWQMVQDKELTRDFYYPANQYTVTIEADRSYGSLNFCFKDAQGRWENNGTKNWNIPVN